MEENKINSTLKPVFAWAGGKRQLLPIIKPRLPENFNDYYEPFLGGGALLFDLQPERATANDTNIPLINTYRQIRDNPYELMEMVDIYDSEVLLGGGEVYLEKRKKFNKKIINNEYDLEFGALFLFLNKHCFNGLYRVNKKGLFNVPYNHKTRPSYEKENILKMSEYLKSINIKNEDFEKACKNAKEGDFIFFDSPYAPLKADSFENYTKEGFGKEDHERLAELFKNLTNKGCYCMLTNHNTELIRNLYKDFKIEEFGVKRMINSDATKRTGKEIIIRNY